MKQTTKQDAQTQANMREALNFGAFFPAPDARHRHTNNGLVDLPPSATRVTSKFVEIMHELHEPVIAISFD
jgi:hypothetical protein